MILIVVIPRDVAVRASPELVVVCMIRVRYEDKASLLIAISGEGDRGQREEAEERHCVYGGTVGMKREELETLAEHARDRADIQEPASMPQCFFISCRGALATSGASQAAKR